NAIRKCRIDFGVNIEIDLRALKVANGVSRMNYAVGTIHYANGVEGRLVYLKSSVTGREPADVLEYQSRHHQFPHEPTANQWFTESQFESYRALGYHIALDALREAALGGPLVTGGDLDDFFSRVEGDWHRAAAR